MEQVLLLRMLRVLDILRPLDRVSEWLPQVSRLNATKAHKSRNRAIAESSIRGGIAEAPGLAAPASRGK